MLLCAAYIPPQQLTVCYAAFADAVIDASLVHDFCSTITVGDFNLPIYDWTQPQAALLSVSVRVLLDLPSLIDLHHIISIKNSRNVHLDLVFSTSPVVHTVALADDPLVPSENIHLPLTITVNGQSHSPTSGNKLVQELSLKRCNLDGVREELVIDVADFDLGVGDITLLLTCF